MSEFKVSLIYRVSSRTARATQRNPVSKNQKKKKKKKEKTKTKTTPSAPKKKWASVLEQELFIWLMSCSVSVGHELWVFCNSSQCS